MGLLEPLDQFGPGFERFYVGCLLFGDAGEDLSFGSVEGVGDEGPRVPELRAGA
jgi:hypothetical protein